MLFRSVPHDARSLPTPFVRGWHEYGFENVPSVDFPDEVYDALFEVVAPIEIPENLPPDAGIELSPVPNEVSTHGPADDERAADEPAPRLWPQDALTKTRRKIFDLPIETQQSAGKPASAIGIANVLGSQAAPARVLLANIEIAVAKRALEAKQSSVLPLPIPGHDRLWNRHADADSADWHFGQFGRMPDEAERNSETQLESSPQRSSERRRLQSLGTQYQEASDRLGDETIFYHLDFLDDGKLPPVTQIEEYNASADEEAREPADEASAVSFEATDVIAVGLQNAAMETAPAKAHEIADAPCEPQEYSAAADIKIDEKTSPDGEDATGSANTDSDIFVAETTTPAIVPDETPSVAAQAEPQVADVAVFGETSNVALTPPLQAEASPAKGWTQRFQTWTRRWLDAGDKPQHSEATIDSDVSSKPTPVAAILPDTVPVEPERTPTKAIASEQLATQSDAWAETWIEIQETLAASNETASEAPIVSDLMPDTVGTGVESSTGESEPVIAAAASERAPEMIEIPTGFAEQPSLDANTAVPLEADPVLIDAEPQIPAVSSEPVAAVSLSAERFTPQTIPVAAEGVSNISLLTVETPLETNASADAAPEVTNAAPADAIPAAQPHAKQDAPESSAPVGEATDALSILRETTEALIKLLGTEAVKTEQIPEMPVAVIANSLREKDDAHTPMFETSIPPPAIAPSVESDVIAVDEVADAAPIVEIKPEKIEARSTRIRSEKPRDKRVRSRTSGERIQPGDSESATPPSDAERPATVKVVGRGKVIKQGNDKKTVNQPTPDKDRKSTRLNSSHT